MEEPKFESSADYQEPVLFQKAPKKSPKTDQWDKIIELPI